MSGSMKIVPENGGVAVVDGPDGLLLPLQAAVKTRSALTSERFKTRDSSGFKA